MGDVRFQAHYDRIKRAKDAAREIYAMDDEGLIQALAAGSADPESQYFMNVLASEALNRIRRARLVEQHIAEGVFALDGDGRITSANPAAQGLLGVIEAELRGRLLYELCERHATGDSTHLCAFMRVYKDARTVSHSEERFLRHDGRGLDVAYTAAPILDEGLVAGVVVAWRDVSASTEWQRRLVETETRYRSLFEHSSEVIVSLDREGRITGLNPAAERVTGYHSRDIVGMRVLPFVTAEDQTRAQAALAAVFAGEMTHGLFDIIDAQGGKRVLDVISVPIVVESKVVGVHAVARDVTETRRLEAELRQSEMRHRLAAEGLRDEAVIFLSPAGTILSWSPGATRIFGWQEDQVRGASYAILFSPHIAAAGLPQEQLKEALRASDIPINGEHVRSDGTPVRAQGRLRCVRGTEGAPAGFVAVLRRKANESEGTVVVCGETIEAASAVFGGLVGSTPSALVGRQIVAFVHPEDHGRLRNAFQGAEGGEAVEVELRLVGASKPRCVTVDVRCLDAGSDWRRWVLLCRSTEDAA